MEYPSILGNQVMAGESFPALVVGTLVEAYLLQRTIFPEETFRTIGLGALGFNLFVLAIWNVVVWPFFLNPLRHLPTIPVCIKSTSRQ